MANHSLPDSKSTSKICTIEGCTSTIEARGYCARHYMRMRLHGDPLATKTNVGSGNSVSERFWSRVNKDAPIRPHMATPCWEWQGNLDSKGYGMIGHQGKKQRCHRFSWFLTFDQWPGLHLLHECDNKICVNPSHLREGTDADNAQDRVERGRHAKGEAAGGAILNEAAVRDIRRLLDSGMKGREVARRFNISPKTVSDIKQRRIWKHVT
jgi:hypothetical protein